MDQNARLKKNLGLIHVFAIALGAMISSGLFVIAGMGHAIAGPAIVWAYLLAGILASTGALSLAELTTAMPRAGGNYFYTMRAFGSAAGTIAGVLSWFSLTLKSAFAIVGMATFSALIVEIHGLLIGALLCVLFVIVNLFGIRQAARLQVALVVGLVGLLGLYTLVGMSQLRSELLIPFAPNGLHAIFFATGFVFVAYGGLLHASSIAEEVRDPGRTIPLGIMLALFAATVVYTLAALVTSGVVESEVLDASLTPISDGGRAIMGQFGYVALSIGAILAFVSTANAGIASAARYLLALSRDQLLPEWLARVNRRFRTPHVAIVVTGATMLLSLTIRLDLLVEAASTVLILTYILSCVSLIVLRESGLQNYQPAFKAPLYPWLQIGGSIGFGFALFAMGIIAYAITSALILSGFLVYWFYGRKRVKQETALLHLLERLTNRKLVTGRLEQELKEIIHERDEVVHDRFDMLVNDAIVLDLDERTDFHALTERVARELAPRLNMDIGTLAQMFRDREADGSTLLSPQMALPHIIVPGQNRFELVLVRAPQGVGFSEDAPEVQTIFALVGSRDQRNLHLRALAAIAQIVQSENFEGRWLAAKNEQGLRDLLLLARRKRQDVKPDAND